MSRGSLLLLLTFALCLWVASANDVNLARIYKRSQLGKQENSVVKVTATPQIFSQTLDHFAPANERSFFNQRYYVNDTFWRPGGPAFLIIGGESELSNYSTVRGAIVEMAQTYGAIVFALEHRFYGESLPFYTLNSSALSYLTSQQALADLVKFRENMLGQYNMTESNKWAVFGCSYSGALAAWFRLKFPNLAYAALSGSSPVEAISSFYQYDQVVAQGLGEACANAIRNATQQVQAVLYSDGSDALKARLGCTGIEDNIAVLYVLADTVAFAVQYDSNMNQSCQAFINSDDSVTTYVNFAQLIYNISGSSCYDFDISSFTNETADPNEMMRQWMWQSCNEFGYFQTAPQNNSLRSTLITEQWHFGVCAKLFNNATEGPWTYWTNSYYGGYNLTTSNTVFSNGALDPWKVLSVTSDLSPSVPSIMIDGVAHCANWRATSASDSPALTSAREQVSAYIGAFLDSCHNATNNQGCGVNGMCTYERGTSSKVTSRCACTNGYSGAACDTKANNQMQVPWWTLIAAGGGAALVTFIITGLICRRSIKGAQYREI